MPSKPLSHDITLGRSLGEAQLLCTHYKLTQTRHHSFLFNPSCIAFAVNITHSYPHDLRPRAIFGRCAAASPNAQPPHTRQNSPASKSHLTPCHCLLSTGAYFPCFVILSSFWYLSLNCDTCMSSYDIRVFVPITFTYYFALPYLSSL